MTIKREIQEIEKQTQRIREIHQDMLEELAEIDKEYGKVL